MQSWGVWQRAHTSDSHQSSDVVKLTARMAEGVHPIGGVGPDRRVGQGEGIQASLMRNRHPVGPCSRSMPRLLGRSWGGRRFLMSKVPL